MTNNHNNLPNSDTLDISALSRLFAKTTTSYKYLYFISLLDILKHRQFEVLSPISFEEIIVEMLVNSWYPHSYFKLSFGTQDKITQKLDSLNLEISKPIIKYTDPDKKLLRKILASQPLNDIVDYLKRYVPFRILGTFLDEELRKHEVNLGRGNDLEKAMPCIAERYFESRKPLYCFNSNEYNNCQSINIHPQWAEYIEKNYMIIRGWASWEWLIYMQNKNPNIPNVINKLFAPQQRETLSKQKKYWKTILETQEIHCIYSNCKLDKNQISLDHYLPWSFVAHEQLWNLIPTIPSVNSSKSNRIPSNRYFENFIRLHHLGLNISSQQLSNSKWLQETESYLADLKINDPSDLLDLERLKRAYEQTMIPLINLASNQGFSNNWIYQDI
jgi:HNH endonuclease